MDLDKALACNKTSPFYSEVTCVAMQEILTSTNGNTNKPLFNEKLNVGKTVYPFVGPQQTYLLSDGTFIVGQLGAVCQTSTDPFIITLNDAGGQLGVTNNQAYLQKVNAQLQKDLNKCLPPGYNADGAISNLRVVQSYSDGRPFKLAGDMGGAARKNPAALLGCLQISNLRVVQSYSDGRPFKLAGDKG